ncbi:DUF1361 domain-containing protein [Neotamlana laminarinivorans]|uniref:DUF1361 domain-containing protein n=1 Tax=Neotamlana laminarinivorans TaxID=2883124 RepID=A0A9X1L4H1_9FLAO|nr:DUF1361 domain-containing protein [Tamlana laminarinivorans]MCB4799514.1 DUF1361 domain-containing protein [Tamlana laminarinivorans]
MENIKELSFNKYTALSTLSITLCSSFFLLLVRMKLAHSFHYLFLIWNLFLAVIPYAITTYLKRSPKRQNVGLVLWLCGWLLFLPNAPYIVTDFVHLKYNHSNYFWLDALVISAFALSGLLLFYFSLLDFNKIIAKKLNTEKANYLSILILFASAFGVYLGRFFRYNSWDIVSNPMNLFIDIANLLVNPEYMKESWIFTITFGVFLCGGFWVFKTLEQQKRPH